MAEDFSGTPPPPADTSASDDATATATAEVAASALNGWTTFQHAVNTQLVGQLGYAGTIRKRTLAALGLG